MAPSEALVAAVEGARAQGSSTAKVIFEALRATNEWTDVTESAVRKALTRAKALAPALSSQERVLQRKQKERERDRLRNRTGRARPRRRAKMSGEGRRSRSTPIRQHELGRGSSERLRRSRQASQTRTVMLVVCTPQSCECSSRAFVSATSALRGMLSRGHRRIGIQLVTGIKKAGPEGGMHRFLAFRRPLRGRMHRFLAVGTTVTCRLHGRFTAYRPPRGIGDMVGEGSKGWDNRII